MTSLKHFILAGVLGTLGVAGLVVPWYSSRTLDTELNAFANGARTGDLVVHKFVHQSGLFNSSGTMEFRLRDSCEVDTEQDPASFSVQYTVSHLPSIRGVMQFEWSLLPQGLTLATIEEIIGPGTKLSGTGAIGFDGLLDMNLDLPELNFSNNGVTFQVTPSKGSLIANSTAIQFVWSLSRFVARGKGEALDMKGLSLNMDLKDRNLGTGTIFLGVESISTSSLSIEGLQVRSETTEIKDQLSSKVSESIKVFKFMGQSMNDLELEASVTGLHAPSVRSLVEIGQVSCGFKNMTADESQKVRKVMETLLTTGMSIGIPTVKGSGADGRVSANLMVELMPASDGTIALEKNLRSSGQLVITGNLLNPGQVDMALATGYADKIPGGLKAAFSYQDGLLKMSDKTLDAGLVKSALAQADKAIENFLHPRVAPARAEAEVADDTGESSAPVPQ